MIIKKKICKGCQEETYIWSRGECKSCAAKSKPRKPIAKKAIVKKFPKPTGELALFLSIWASRPHVCEVTGEPLGEFDVRYFSHVLSKGAFPKFRLYDKNIVLKSPEMHSLWEFHPHSELAKDIRWEKILTLKEELKQEYFESR